MFGQNTGRTTDKNAKGDFELADNAAIQRIITLRKPGPALRPAFRSGLLWRLVSHLSLNYMSLVSEGREALQDMLRLYNFANTPFFDRQINGILNVKSSARFARVASDHGIVFARGTRVEMDIDEEQFTGGGVWLFASVLERFLGQSVSMNSFSQLSVTTPQRKDGLKEWPPRAGNKILV